MKGVLTFLIKIFDKKSYSIVGVIKTNHCLVFLINDKMFYKNYNKNWFEKMSYEIQYVPCFNLSSFDAFCKFNLSKEAHLLRNPYILPCSNLACLDCIYHHYNIFRRSFQCLKCNQAHNLPQEFRPINFSIKNDLFNKTIFFTLIDETKKVISNIDSILFLILIYFNLCLILENREDIPDKTFSYINHEFDLRIESLKIKIEIIADKLINKINKFIEIKALNQSNIQSGERVFFQSKGIIHGKKVNIGLEKIGLIYNQLNIDKIDDLHDGGIEKLIEKLCKFFNSCH